MCDDCILGVETTYGLLMGVGDQRVKAEVALEINLKICSEKSAEIDFFLTQNLFNGKFCVCPEDFG